MRYVPLIILAVVLLGLLAWTRRAKMRSAESDARMRRDITVGTQVMTTSGLYGTVVALNSDDTVILAIAPGVEVRWAFAALRDIDALPPRYRQRPATGSSGSNGFTGTSGPNGPNGAIGSAGPGAGQPVRSDGADDSG